MANWGRHAEAVASLLAFDCYLRRSEYLSLRYRDVARFNDPRNGDGYAGMTLRLAHTKTGPNQWVPVRSAVVAQAFTNYLDSRNWRSSDRVFPFSASHWSRLLRQVCVALGMAHIPFVPHSFRHGGATRDFMLGVGIEQIKLHGRCKSTESARRYIQQGPALLLLHTVPEQVMRDARVLAPCLVEALLYFAGRVPDTQPRARRLVHFH